MPKSINGEKIVTVRMTAELHASLRKVTNQLDISMNKFLIQAAEDRLMKGVAPNKVDDIAVCGNVK
jgi:hypothetical protein